MQKRLGLSILLSMALCQAAFAQQPADGRYQLERTDDGFVRLDKETGEISTCLEENGQLVCRMAADERRAFADELDRMSDRLAAVEEELGTASDESAAESEIDELDRAMGMMERFVRRFFALVDDLNREYGLGEDPAADQT